MKRFNKFNQIPFLGYLVFLSIWSTSCQKSEIAPGGNNIRKEQEQTAARILVKRLPKITIYDDKTKSSLRITTDGFSFSDNSEGGFNFSDPRGATYTNTGTGGQFVVASQGFGLNAGGSGGGLIQAGSSSMNVKYTFCFSADQSFFGADLFGGENNSQLFTGVSGVIGVDGDFSQLQSGEGSSADPEDIFSGLGMYIVYDARAQGSYQILNWVDLVLRTDEQLNIDDLKDKGFAFFIDFKNKKVYLSYSGNMNVSGGSMTFTGKYFELSEGNGEEPEIKIVDGLGTMGCN